MNFVKSICILYAILLAGCMQEITRHDIDKASVICEKYENILKIRFLSSDDKYVLCYQNEKEIRIGGSK